MTHPTSPCLLCQTVRQLSICRQSGKRLGEYIFFGVHQRIYILRPAPLTRRLKLRRLSPPALPAVIQTDRSFSVQQKEQRKVPQFKTTGRCCPFWKALYSLVCTVQCTVYSILYLGGIMSGTRSWARSISRFTLSPISWARFLLSPGSCQDTLLLFDKDDNRGVLSGHFSIRGQRRQNKGPARTLFYYGTKMTLEGPCQATLLLWDKDDIRRALPGHFTIMGQIRH